MTGEAHPPAVGGTTPALAPPELEHTAVATNKPMVGRAREARPIQPSTAPRGPWSERAAEQGRPLGDVQKTLKESYTNINPVEHCRCKWH